MNWDTLKGNWKQFKGKIQEEWGELTDDDCDEISGEREQLSGKIQKRYGLAKAAVETQINEWERKVDNTLHEIRRP